MCSVYSSADLGESGLEPTISSLEGKRLIHEAIRRIKCRAWALGHEKIEAASQCACEALFE